MSAQKNVTQSIAAAHEMEPEFAAGLAAESPRRPPPARIIIQKPPIRPKMGNNSPRKPPPPGRASHRQQQHNSLPHRELATSCEAAANRRPRAASQFLSTRANPLGNKSSP